MIKGPDFWNMLAMVLLQLICKLEVQTLRRIKTSNVFCISGGSEGQKSANAGEEAETTKAGELWSAHERRLTPSRERSSFATSLPSKYERAEELCGLSLQIPCHVHLAY